MDPHLFNVGIGYALNLDWSFRIISENWYLVDKR
jgi:hypothetical protein